MQNAGDDAFLDVTAWGARKYCKCQRLSATADRTPLLQSGPVRSLFLPQHWRVVSRWNQYRKVRAAKRSSFVIWGGGSTLSHEHVLDRDIAVLDAISTGTAFAVGVSIGPFRTSGDEAACARFINRLAFVGVRDRVSLERAAEIAPDANVQLTFDLAPLLPLVSSTTVGDAETQNPAWEVGLDSLQRQGLGIALCNYERFTGGDTRREAARIEVVAHAVRECVASGLVREVVFVDFNAHPTMGDHELHAELARQVPGGAKVRHLAYTGDPLALMRAVGGLRGMLAMRLHAAVFAFCADTPAVMLSYHEKCRQWAEMVGVPEEFVLDTAELSHGELVGALNRLMSEGVPMPDLTPLAARQRALGNWRCFEV